MRTRGLTEAFQFDVQALLLLLLLLLTTAMTIITTISYYK